MVRLACIVSSCYLPTGKSKGKGEERALRKYESQTYDSDPEGDIYEFTEKDAEIAMASGNFERV